MSSDPPDRTPPAPLSAPGSADPNRVSDSGASRRWVEVQPGGVVDGACRPPGSKSITNRALLCAAFASGPSVLTGALRSEDTGVMIAALSRLGIGIEVGQGGRVLRVAGREPGRAAGGGRPLDLFVGNSGTTIRFLTAALSALGGDYRLHGIARMHERPIGDLVDALDAIIDGTVAAESPGRCPPVVLRGRGWRGHSVGVSGSVSSQFLSGLMMAAPISGHPAEIQVRGELVSRPYVEMTAGVMRAFGAEVELVERAERAEPVERADPVERAELAEPVEPAGQTRPASADPGRGTVAAGPSDPEGCERSVLECRIGAAGYRGREFAIEPDASAASYFWAAAAITGGTVTVEGLHPAAMQGDVAFCEVLEKMGCEIAVRGEDDPAGPAMTVRGRPLNGVDVDMNAISDTVQTLAVAALFARGPTRVRGVAHNRYKETDRIADVARELRKFGAEIAEHADGLTITPPPRWPETPTVLETYGDHRMAMSLALAGLRVPGVRVLDPACTAKTYPEFFADLEALIGRSHHWGGEPEA